MNRLTERPTEQNKWVTTYQSVGLEKKVDSVADDFNAEFQFKAIHHEIVDVRQNHGQHRMSAVCSQHKLPALLKA